MIAYYLHLHILLPICIIIHTADNIARKEAGGMYSYLGGVRVGGGGGRGGEMGVWEG